MSENCKLRESNGECGQLCDGEKCIFWRAAEMAVGEGAGEGCAIQHYQLLGDSEVAAWLLSVKERLQKPAQ